MMRFTAYLLIVIASYLLAANQCNRLTRAILLQEGIYDFLQYVKRSVLCYRLSLEDIVTSFQNEALEAVGFYDAVYQSGSLLKAFDTVGRDFLFLPEETRAIRHFFFELGTLTVSEQLISCEDALSVLDKGLTKRKSEYSVKRRLYMTLGLCAGFSIVVLLI